MDDKYSFTDDQERLFFDKNLVQLIHTTGKLENLSTSLPDTEAI